jgi:iron only hydrogenase large subunit-like protein/uncharacterized Fe-S cluster-containing protein
LAEFLKLKKSNCKNCYKCIRNCPVKSINFSAGQANIVGSECILCGQCFVICPQNAKEIVSDIDKVKRMISDGRTVIASVAPSFAANYNGIGITALECALKKLGFYAAEETAIGATIVKKEYERMLMQGDRDILITSCCHSVNLLIQKYFPNELQYLADIVSPMHAHTLDIRRRYGNASVVFIGPCVAKKDEAGYYAGNADAVLTFEELTKWLNEEHIELGTEKDSSGQSRARFFPTTGGVLRTMKSGRNNYTFLAVDGTENCIAALRDIERGELHRCFIEMSACTGSCIGGPVMEKYHRSPIRDFKAIAEYAGNDDFEVKDLPAEKIKKQIEIISIRHEMPTENEIAGILRQTGKIKQEQQLNCGSCGYNTCREKAIAVFQGKADLSMCLPFLKENYEVQQINKAALEIMNIRSPSDVLGEQVVRILDPKDFIDVKTTGKGIFNRRTYLAEYKKYVDETIIYDKEYRILICLMRDITELEKEREKKETISRQTIEIADKVVEKQMRIVQEIASLLGETAAETKIALTKLKESISDE